MEEGTVGILIGLIISFIIFGVGGLIAPDHHATQLANSICEEKYNTEFKRFKMDSNDILGWTITEVICENSIQNYDGLIVKLE